MYHRLWAIASCLCALSVYTATVMCSINNTGSAVEIIAYCLSAGATCCIYLLRVCKISTEVHALATEAALAVAVQLHSRKCYDSTNHSVPTLSALCILAIAKAHYAHSVWKKGLISDTSAAAAVIADAVCVCQQLLSRCATYKCARLSDAYKALTQLLTHDITAGAGSA
eukprot:1107-Heterococcus_DN1.PRE.6